MSKKLVAYFSASGITEGVAKNLATAADADIYEIRPEVAYTRADLNWNDKSSRSSIEMSDPTSRPKIAKKVDNMQQYDTVFVGFPVWWYVAPTIINSFLESYDFSGKNIVLFATSGVSGLGDSQKVLETCIAPTAKWIPGKRLARNVSTDELKKWIDGLEL